MIGRAVVIVSLLSLTFTQTVIAQCNFQPARTFQFRSSVYDVAVDGPFVLAANGYGLATYNGTTLTQTLPLPGTTRIVRIVNGNRYVGSGTGIFAIVSGTTVAVAGSTDAGATVNDIAGAGSFLYVATSNGLQQYDISNVNHPTRTSATFATSGTNVTSLAIDANTLYAADSDNSVEVFSIANPGSPQKTGTIASLPRVTSVKLFNGQLLASDGVQTDVFLLTGTGTTKLATLPFGTNALTVIDGDVVAAAGTDRRLHIVDISRVGGPVELFAADLIPGGGTINRIGAVAKSGNQLYVASGDAGLQVYDLTGFAAPYPLRSYGSGATSSVLTTGNRIYASGSSSGIVELGLASSGEVTQLRQWDNKQDTVQDFDNGFLLTSSGATLTYWTLGPSSPVVVSTVSFKNPVASAVVVKNSAYAVLTDQTIWLADLSLATPQPQQLTTNAQHPGFIARSGTSIAIADLRTDGTTVIVNYPTGNTLQIPRTATVPGVATAFAHSGNLAAVFTFRGITVVDLASGSQAVMSQSNAIPTSLALDGTNVLATYATALTVWNARTGALVRTLALPSQPVRVSVPDPGNGYAAIATANGVTSVAYNSSTKLPAAIPLPTANAYYKKVLAAKNRLYLFDGRGADVFETTAGLMPHYVTRIAPGGTVDVAASDAGLYALTSSAVVYAFGPDGTSITQRTIDTSTDTQPLSIVTVAGAPWVSLSQQCRTGTCQNNTLVLDPLSLAQTSTMTGAILDVTTSGSRAYAVTSLPSEVRVIDISVPLHPAQLSARSSDVTTASVSIAYSSGNVFVLADKLYSYNESGLAKVAEQSVPFDQPTYADQRIALAGNCAIVTGRTSAAALYAMPAFTATGSVPIPANAKSIAVSANEVFVLTEDSVEVWSNGTVTPAPRHRAVR